MKTAIEYAIEVDRILNFASPGTFRVNGNTPRIRKKFSTGLAQSKTTSCKLRHIYAIFFRNVLILTIFTSL